MPWKWMNCLRTFFNWVTSCLHILWLLTAQYFQLISNMGKGRGVSFFKIHVAKVDIPLRWKFSICNIAWQAQKFYIAHSALGNTSYKTILTLKQNSWQLVPNCILTTLFNYADGICTWCFPLLKYKFLIVGKMVCSIKQNKPKKLSKFNL